MKNKCTQSVNTSQHLIAGLLPGDSAIEFYGIPNTMEVQWIQNGHTHSFDDLSPKIFIKLANAFNSNAAAKETLGKMASSFKRKVELFTYFMYGDCDSQPDFVNGELQEHENYRHSEDCISLNFKSIKLHGSELKRRELMMIDLMSKGDPKDDIAAPQLGIAVSTYNQHKRELFNKTGYASKPALLIGAMRDGVARFFS